jgi:ribonuclease VapC
VIVDSSALLAVMNSEPDARELGERIEAAADPRISAATLVETSIVAGRKRQHIVDELLAWGGITVIPFDEEQARMARQAYVTYGKGSGSRARLNFGDCFSYALAKVSGQPLLFKGADFTHTDIESALLP